MLHHTLRGTHYQIGLRLGSSLAGRGCFLPSQAPFPVTEERLAFARACLPLYQAWFPSALEELRGLAEGQGCSQALLAGLVLSMYAMPPAVLCSCFALRKRGGSVLFGRNSDFLTALEDRNASCLVRPADSGFSFIGNTTSFLQMEDGVNEAGLAVGLTSVPPAGPPRPGLNAGIALRLLLESCATVEEALILLRQLPLSSCHTLVLADRTGDLALAECSPERTAVLRPAGPGAFVCAVNSFHLPEMASFRREIGDDWQAEERYQTLTAALSRLGADMNLQNGAELLGGKYGFLSQYDRAQGRDTVWSVLWDGGRLLRAEGNPLRVPFQEDKRLNRGS